MSGLGVYHGKRMLPPSWRTLYELPRLNGERWAAVEPHLSSTLERKQIKALIADDAEDRKSASYGHGSCHSAK